MILQQLYGDADAIMRQTGRGALPPPMYMPKPVKWIVDLVTDPSLPSGFCQFVATPGEKKKGIVRTVPFVKRTTAPRPLLLADKTSYTLKIRVPDAKRDTGRNLADDLKRTTDEHALYRALIHACAKATGNPLVARVAAFLDAWDPAQPPENVEIPKDLGRDDIFLFRVDGEFPTDDPAIQKFWLDTVVGSADVAGEPGDGETAVALEDQRQCLVSGLIGPVEEMMPVPVKGLPGGKSEMAIVSANAAAFESYGLTRAQTSPISREAGERFGQALNALIASEKHRVTGGNVIYIYWARGGTVRLRAFNPPTGSRELSEFIRAVHSGDTSWANDQTALNKLERFHIFGLSANVARVVVRSALDTTIEEVGLRQADWFQRLEVIGPVAPQNPAIGTAGYPLPLRTLAVAAYREFKDIPAAVDDALVRTAFAGDPLPETLLQALVLRCRYDAENRITYPRAALLKYILTQKLPLEDSRKMTTEVTTDDLPFEKPEERWAYHCGRLFSELEEIQKQAIPGLNAGISEKFYGSASANPASVFGILLADAQNHLSKLRKEKEGAYNGASRRLEEILAYIQQFPKTLTLHQQALFSLGYYHHRAAKRKDIAERSAAKKLASTTVPGNATNPEGEKE